MFFCIIICNIFHIRTKNSLVRFNDFWNNIFYYCVLLYLLAACVYGLFYVNFFLQTHSAAPTVLYYSAVMVVVLLLLLVYRSDRYRRIEDKMDNKNDSLCAYYSARAEGAENNNCERTHYARQGEKNVWHGHVCKSHKNNKTGAEVHIYIRKGSGFFYFFFFKRQRLRFKDDRVHYKLK